MIVTSSDFLNSSFSIKSHPDSLIGLHKLIELTGKLFVLDGNDSDVVVKRVNLNLEVRVVVQKSTVAVTGALKFFSHIHYLVLFSADLCFKILDGSSKFNIA